MNKCPICGNPTNKYMGNERKDGLCKEHAKKLKDGLICQDENGKWIIKEEPKTPATENKSSELTCLICGKPSNGQHFCKECWNKYKDKAIEVRIKNCKEFTITDSYGNKDTKTANGLYVRSLSEKIIYDELFRRNIKCEYERTVTYKNEKGEIKELHPDFYLTDYKVYIEHWGYLEKRNKEYEESKRFKENIYKNKGYKFSATTSQDIRDIQSAIERILIENDIET